MRSLGRDCIAVAPQEPLHPCSPLQGIPLALPGPQTECRERRSWQARTYSPSQEVPNDVLIDHTGKALAWAGLEYIPVGPGQEMNGAERNEKQQRTKPIDESQGVCRVHCRATGADAAWAAHPGPDHRPRPPATTGFPAWGWGRGLPKGRGLLARLWSPAGSPFRRSVLSPQGRIFGRSYTTNSPPAQWLISHYMRAISRSQ